MIFSLWKTTGQQGPACVDPGLVEGKSGGKGLSQGPLSAGAR